MMIELIGKPAMLEQLAEECFELISAFESSMHSAVIEEYTDVITCGRELGLTGTSVPKDDVMNEGFAGMIDTVAKLGKAALKRSRALRKENPTPVKPEEAEFMMEQLYQKMLDLAYLFGLKVDEEEVKKKQERFRCRWVAEKEENK